MSSIAVVLPDAAPFRSQGAAIIERAKAINIVDDESYQEAARELLSTAALQKSIKRGFEIPKKSAFETHRSITQLEGSLLAFPNEAERIVKRKISDYTVEQDRQRRIREAQAAAEEKSRQDAAALDEADALQDAGDHRGAAQVLEEAVSAPAPVIELPKPSAPGVTTRKTYTWRFTDEGRSVNRKFLVPDESAIGKLVRALGQDAAEIIGGIEVVEERVVSARPQAQVG